jgi:hypothetical protein
LVKFTSQNLLTISPNPASDFITVYSSRNTLNLHLYDVAGKRVLLHKLTDGSAQINISKFAKGIYTLVAEKDGLTLESSKIVKQ